MVVRPRRATAGTRWECTGLTPGVSCGSVVDRLSTLTARLHCTDGTSPARHDLPMIFFAFWTRTSTTYTWRKRTCFAPSVCGSSVVEGLSTVTAGLHCTDGTRPAWHDFHMVFFAFWTTTATRGTWRKGTRSAPRVCGSFVVDRFSTPTARFHGTNGTRPAWQDLRMVFFAGRGHPQLVHGGNAHVLHHVSVEALLLIGCPH